MNISLKKILGYITLMLAIAITGTVLLRVTFAHTELSEGEELLVLIVIISVVSFVYNEIARRLGLFREPPK